MRTSIHAFTFALLFVFNMDLILAAPIDITFFVVSDLHYGYAGMQAASQATIDRMNALPGTAYPQSIGGTVDVPRGVLILGDLTQSGLDSASWVSFVFDWGLNGNARLSYPVYEGYGNHDKGPFVRQGIKSRNLLRTGVVNRSTNGYHYSLDWDQVHVVHCNLYASNGPWLDEGGSPDSALTFLRDDLAQNVGNSGRPVVIVQHYGWDVYTAGFWWQDSEKAAMYETIKEYNVIGIFHGHCHCVDTAMWNGIVTYDDGSIKDHNQGNFFVVRIRGDKMTVVNRNNGVWDESWTTTIDPGSSTQTLLPAIVRRNGMARGGTFDAVDIRGRLIHNSPASNAGKRVAFVNKNKSLSIILH